MILIYSVAFPVVTDQLFSFSRFEKYLAAEALRINENDAEKALDLLTNPEENCILQVCLLCTPMFRYSQKAAAQLFTHFSSLAE